MVSPLGPCMSKAFMCNVEEQFQLQGKMAPFRNCYFDDNTHHEG